MEKIRKEDIAQLRFLSGILLSPDKNRQYVQLQRAI